MQFLITFDILYLGFLEYAKHVKEASGLQKFKLHNKAFETTILYVLQFQQGPTWFILTRE